MKKTPKMEEVKSYSTEPVAYEQILRGNKIWRVRLGTRFLGKGYKAEKHFFKSKKDAESFVSRQIQEKQGSSLEARSLKVPEKLLNEAKVVQSKLGKKVSLLEVVNAWKTQIEPFLGSPLVSDAILELHQFKEDQNQSERHTRELKAKLQRLFRGLETKRLAEITPQDMERVLKVKDAKGHPPSASQRVKRMRYATILFNWGIQKGYCSVVPLSGVARPKIIGEAPTPLRPLEVSKLLFTCYHKHPEALPALAIKLFAGLRNSEMFLLDWKSISSSNIAVSVASSKTNKARSITLEPILEGWFKSVPSLKREGLVFKMNPGVKDREAVWLEVIKSLEDETKIEIKQNALRHTFGSYHYHRYKSAEKTAFEMGNSARVVVNNYVDGVNDADCSVFWIISLRTTFIQLDGGNVPDERSERQKRMDKMDKNSHNYKICMLAERAHRRE